MMTCHYIMIGYTHILHVVDTQGEVLVLVLQRFGRKRLITTVEKSKDEELVSN